MKRNEPIDVRSWQPSARANSNDEARLRPMKNVTPITKLLPPTSADRDRDTGPGIVPASAPATPAAFQLPATALHAIDQMMQKLLAASDKERMRISEDMVLIAKDFCDVATFMGEGIHQFQHRMEKAAESKRIIAGHECDQVKAEQATDILEATHPAQKRTDVANAETLAIAAEVERDAAKALATDHRLSSDPDSVRWRKIARETVLDAVLGQVKVTDANYYRAFARLLYDLFAHRLDHEPALEKATAILAARMEEEDFNRATGSEFYDLFIERRAGAARERQERQTETLQRLKTDEELHKARRMQDLKAMTDDGGNYDPTV